MKPSLLLPLAMAAMALPAAVHAQSNDPTPRVAQGNTLLTLSADARVERKPDLANFNAGVTTQGKTAGEALAANSTAMNRVVAALRQAGIADRDIQTANLNLTPVYQPQVQRPDGTYVPADPKIIGYNANNTVNIRQRDLSKFGAVLDTLVEAGANTVNGPSFGLDDPDSALDEARTDAMKKARARAELYARAAGLRVLRILSISESGGYSPPPPMPMMVRGGAMMESAPTPIASGEVTLNANVTVLFELAP